MSGPRDWSPDEPAGWLPPEDPAWRLYADGQRGAVARQPDRVTSSYRAAPAVRRPWGIAFMSFVAGIGGLWVAAGPIIARTTGGHGYVLSTVGVAAVLLGLNAVRRNRVVPNLGVLSLSVIGIGTGVIATVAMVGGMVTSGSVPVGNPLAGGASGTRPGSGLQWAPSATQVQLTSIGVEGAGTARTAVVGNGGSVRLGAGYTLQSYESDPTISVRLERRVAGGAWTPTGVSTSVTEGAALSVNTPAYATAAATETVEYRFASDASASQPVSVVYENQRLYTGMAATIYRYAAPYCPTTAVHVTELDGREAGEYGTGSLLILVSTAVGITANQDPVSQRTVALHECSHELQWLNYGGSQDGYDRMRTAAAAIFTTGANGASAIEHAADCGALALEPAGYLGYGGFCTQAELDAGARLLRGGRY